MSDIKMLYTYLQTFIYIMSEKTPINKRKKDIYIKYFNKYFSKYIINIPIYIIDGYTYISKYDMCCIKSLIQLVIKDEFKDIYNYFYDLAFFHVQKYVCLNRDVNIIEEEINNKILKFNNVTHFIEYKDLSKISVNFVKFNKIIFENKEFNDLKNDINNILHTLQILTDEINILKNDNINQLFDANSIDSDNIINDLNNSYTKNKIILFDGPTYNYEKIKERNKELNKEFKKIYKFLKFTII